MWALVVIVVVVVMCRWSVGSDASSGWHCPYFFPGFTCSFFYELSDL
jgi:hypothetical protein